MLMDDNTMDMIEEAKGEVKVHTFEELLKSLCVYKKDTEDTAAQRLPKVLEVKKMKYLQALGKCEFTNSNMKINAEDEEFVLKHLYNEPIKKHLSLSQPLIFDDSIVTTKFKELKKPEFDMKIYITSVKWIYANYLDLEFDVPIFDLSLSNTLAYVLAFARDFDDPTKNIFHFSESGSTELSGVDIDELLTKQFPGNTLYINKLNTLLADLLESYSEEKYQLINLNVTYMILLMLRRVVKTDKEFANSIHNDKTHSDYWELCPRRLDYRLPVITDANNEWLDTKLRHRDDTAVVMVLHAYTQCGVRTRRALRATCMRHMEHTGLALPALFNKVARLYTVDEEKLWDVLSSEACGGGLMLLSDLYHAQATGASEQPPKTYNLFPYCRVLNSHYHGDMSAKYNMNYKLCYVLAYLVDLKYGLDVSSARRAHWTRSVGKGWEFKLEALATTAYETLKP